MSFKPNRYKLVRNECIKTDTFSGCADPKAGAFIRCKWSDRYKTETPQIGSMGFDSMRAEISGFPWIGDYTSASVVQLALS